MKIKSKDTYIEELKSKFEAALASEDEAALPQVMADFASALHDDVMADAQKYQKTQDAGILDKRGIRALTAEETKFYTALGESAKTRDIKSAFTKEGIKPALPETVIDAVLEDIGTNFPLLAAINIQNANTLTKLIVNKQGMQLAAWGALGSAVTTELEGAIAEIDIGTNKLTAYMVVSKDMLDAGPKWIDAYVRAVLSEAVGAALCKAIVAGTGKDQPIGMLKDVSKSASVQGGVYPDKAATKITDLDVKTLGTIAKTIAEGPNKRKRAVPELLMVVNPADYFGKILPATTILTANGTYVNNVLPYPTKIVQDENVPDGKAIFGLASRYFLGVGKGGAGGTITFSDEFKYLDDQRVYMTKLYGNGMPLDENAFVVADITGLKENMLKVQMVSDGK